MKKWLVRFFFVVIILAVWANIGDFVLKSSMETFNHNIKNSPEWVVSFMQGPTAGNGLLKAGNPNGVTIALIRALWPIIVIASGAVWLWWLVAQGGLLDLIGPTWFLGVIGLTLLILVVRSIWRKNHPNNHTTARPIA